ncbi:MAG: energy-coupling factor transporter ATPase [Candidatus Limivicinus sp.]|jgi:energy-coupling factor transport system ATP-binding protein
MEMIKAENLVHSYLHEGSKHRSLDDFSLDVRGGELVAVLGHNGCGKTTLARHLNVLLPLQGGKLSIAGYDAANPDKIWQIRKSCGMVFQNPDNQFVSSYVEEDIAFAPRNFGTVEEEIPERVKKALAEVGMSGYERRSPQLLSGGQKQRIAIAGVLAADPDIMIFDEVTSMLDPQGRREVLMTVKKLHEAGKTIIMISHYVEEAVMADRVVLMHDGRKIADGEPREVLSNRELMREAGLTPPFPVRVYYDLLDAGAELERCPLNIEELVDEICL